MINDHALYIRHGGKQLEYVNEKVEYLKKYITPASIKTNIDKKGFTYRYAYYNDRSLKFIYSKIYKNKKKVISDSILNRINAISLAFFYMDDGCLVLRKDKKGCIGSREIYLATHSFSLHEVQKFRNLLFNKFNIDFHISFEKGKPRMWCNTSNTIKFLTLIAPIVKEFPTMHYKLDLKYKKKNIKFI